MRAMRCARQVAALRPLGTAFKPRYAFSTNVDEKDIVKPMDPREKYSFLDPNNPPELPESLVSKLSDDGWKRVKPQYPDDFKSMITEVTMDGVPDYNQMSDLSAAFRKTDPVPYYVEEGKEKRGKIKNPCVLCDHYQVKMCDKLHRVEYTNINLLNKFVNERGMINSSRVNGTCPVGQRHMAWLIRRARQVGVMSFLERWQVGPGFMKKMKWLEEGKDT
eukprot:944111-Amorphochlora_amoeboformis.AAC.1